MCSLNITDFINEPQCVQGTLVNVVVHWCVRIVSQLGSGSLLHTRLAVNIQTP